MKKLILFLLIGFLANAQNKSTKKADSLLYLGNYKAALLVLDKDNTFRSLSRQGAIYKQVTNYTKAIESYTKALLLQKDDKIKEELGKCYQKSNQSTKAIALYNEVLVSNPKNLLLQYQLAKLYKSKRKLVKAKKLFKNLIIQDTLNPNYYYYLGSTYLNLKEKDSAKLQFLKAIKLDSSHFKSLYNLAKSYRKKKNKYTKFLKKMISNDTSYFYLNKGLSLYPKSNSLNELASKYTFLDKKYEQTIVYLNNLSFLNAENKQTLATAYYFTKDYEKALDHLYSLVDKRKASGKTFFYLSLVYKDQNNIELAEKYMNFAIQVEQPQLTEYYFQLGMIYQKDKQFQKAIDSFKRAMKDYPYNDKAKYQLAITCDSYYKDKSIAVKHYKEYLRKFKFKDKKTAEFVKQRIVELNTKLHLKTD